MPKIVLGLNALDPTSWTTHEVENVFLFLRDTFGERFPETGKIFHGSIDKQNEVTPAPGDRASALRLLTLEGTIYVIVYPAGPSEFLNLGILIGGLIISWLLAPDPKPAPPSLHPVTGSPNNKLGDRQNNARVLGRIPDIFGQVRSTPDLLQLPYTLYVNDRETEICYMCVGKGDIQCTDVRDGDMLAGQIEGMDVTVFGPGEIPVLDAGLVVAGNPITEPVYTVRRVEAVNGQPLLAENAKTFVGDIPLHQFNDTDIWANIHFAPITASTGAIHLGGSPEEVLSKIKVGDKLDIVAPPSRITTGSGSNPMSTNGKTRFMRLSQPGTGPRPDLTGTGADAVTVLSIDTNAFYNVVVSIPVSMQAQWAAITTYTAGLLPIFQGHMGNHGALITPQDSEWVGPFFVENPIAAPLEQTIVCNFVAQEGLYADDGKSFKPFNVRVQVEITPANSLGFPSGLGPVQVEDALLLGSIASRNTRGLTMRIVPVTPGNFLIRARRITRTPWKQDSPSQYAVAILRPDIGTGIYDIEDALAITGPRIGRNGNKNDPDPNGTDTVADKVQIVGGGTGVYFTNSSYLPFYGNSQDNVLWTHCYSLTTIAQSSLGDITSIQTRTIASEGATRNKERRLNLLAYRRIQTWNGSTFGGALVENNLAENVLFFALKDKFIGNLDNALIDFPGIAAAFASVRAYFGGPTSDGFGGDEAGQFNYTFDDEKVSLEETISIICNACFCVPYREGDILKVRPDLARVDAKLLVNHRNRLPGSEQRTVAFGTEADFDGVRVDYTAVDINDPTNDAIQTYTVPPLGVASRPKVIQVPGIRLKKHAAWHAWRAYNKLLYSNTTTEFQACEEAMQLTLNDRVLVADGTRAQTQDGDILAISGSTLTTSQKVVLTGGATYTIFLQHVDGTVESIPVASSPDFHTVVLAAAPSVALVTNPDLGVRTMYWIVKNDFTPATAFLVTEKSPSDKGTYNITATNYSHAYYWQDGLYFWLPFIQQTGLAAARDWGPYELSTSSINGASSTVDGVRGLVYLGTANDQHIQITTSSVFASESYTKSCWVFWTAGNNSSILSKVEDSDEAFLISTTGEVRGIHNNTAYCQSPAPISGSTWVMLSLTYDAVTDIMLLYVDGELVDTALAVPGRPLGNLRIFGQFEGVNGFIGRADDLRYWMRVLASEEIRELYRKTKIP
jgi:hypothetical protein